MSTIWTPGGEQPVSGSGGSGGAGEELTDEELEAHVEELRRELADTPAFAVVANHVLGLFQLAALHLSLQPPKLDQAQLAIDAMGALVEGLAGRLGPDEQQLRDGLSQLRIAFVQIKASATSGGGSAPAPGAAPEGG